MLKYTFPLKLLLRCFYWVNEYIEFYYMNLFVLVKVFKDISVKVYKTCRSLMLCRRKVIKTDICDRSSCMDSFLCPVLKPAPLQTSLCSAPSITFICLFEQVLLVSVLNVTLSVCPLRASGGSRRHRGSRSLRDDETERRTWKGCCQETTRKHGETPRNERTKRNRQQEVFLTPN